LIPGDEIRIPFSMPDTIGVSRIPAQKNLNRMLPGKPITRKSDSLSSIEEAHANADAKNRISQANI